MPGSPLPPGERQAAPGPDGAEGNRGLFPLGAAVTMRDLDGELHPLLRRLREREPVSWLPALGGWLVTRRDLALRVLRDTRTFTVDDPRFSTARVIGPSMLSLDGAEHKRHRAPFAEAFRLDEIQDRLEEFVEAEAERLVSGFAAAGRAELRRDLAGPLAVAAVADVLGLGQTDPRMILSWYDQIVGAVSALAGESGEPGAEPGSAGPGGPEPQAGPMRAGEPEPEAGPMRAGEPEPEAGPMRAGEPEPDRVLSALTRGSEAFGKLSESLHRVIARESAGGTAGARGNSLLAAAAGAGELSRGEVVSNAAVLAFGGIETTEGMICNAVLHLLSHPGQFREVAADRRLAGNAVEESLRLEPAAAVVDRYATTDVSLAAAAIRRGDLVTVSLAGAGRDPAFFPNPGRFDVRRANARQNLAFAHGPHFCLGAHLARLEARAAVLALARLLPGLRLDPARRQPPRGVVFRKPASLHVLWDVP
jgi:cytochrome P450